MLKICKTISILSALLLLSGCLTTPTLPEQTCDESIPINLSDSEYLIVTSQMVDEMIASDSIARLSDQRRLNVYVEKVKNTSTQAINSEHIELALKNRLTRSAKINIKDDPVQADYLLTVDFSNIAVECNEKINQFRLSLQQKDSHQIIWTEYKNYQH